MMINSPSSLNRQIKHSQFRCGCGVQLKDNASFKEHSLFVHNGQFQKESTHYLTKFTLLVLPLLQPIQNANLQFQPTQSTKIRNKKKSHKTNLNKNIQQPIHQALILKNESKSQAENKQIQWNGFRLIVNKFCRFDNYYCGNCQIEFRQPEQFITHCIESCQQLKNKKSSHFIGCVFDKQKSVNLSKQKQTEANQIAPTKQNEKRKTRINQRPKIKVRYVDPIEQILKTNLDHRNLPFRCGLCNLMLERQTYRYHMTGFHSQLIDSSSSHVILRTSKGYCIYLSPEVQWINDETKYYCICKPQVKMKMDKLIKHVREVHKGISPRYNQSIQH